MYWIKTFTSSSSSSGSSRGCCVSASGVLYVGWARGVGRACTFQMPNALRKSVNSEPPSPLLQHEGTVEEMRTTTCARSRPKIIDRMLGVGPNVVDRMCCCNLLFKANGMVTAVLRRVAWVPGACGRFFFGGKQTSKQAKLKRRQQGRSTAKRT